MDNQEKNKNVENKIEKFTHFDQNGNAVMVDVSGKKETERKAVARGRIAVNDAVFQAVKNGTVKKGDVLGVARIAGSWRQRKTVSSFPCAIF